MVKRLFEVASPSVLTTEGDEFVVRRIFCVGRNYVAHIKEMGGDLKSTPPTFFTKPADSVCMGGDIPYPLATENLHFEAELVVALKAGGTHIAAHDSAACIYGYGVGCDLTRRDLQSLAKTTKGPWDNAKALDNGAVIGRITPRSDVLQEGAIELSVNGETRQSSNLAKMIWTIPEIIEKLSGLFELKAGDLIYTGTPEGVGEIVRGDKVEITVDGLTPVSFTLTDMQV